jgi:integrase
MPKLTEQFIKALSVEEGKKDKLAFDAVCPGLGVRVTKAGAKVFIAQWTDPATKRKQRDRLGVWPTLTLEQARAATRSRLGDVAKGHNPLQERAKAKAEAERLRAEEALTLAGLIDSWAALHLEQHCRPGYAAEAQRALRYAFKNLLARPAARVKKAELLPRLDALTKSGKRTTAGRTVAYGRAAYNWALRRGMVRENPFAELPIAVPNQARERVLSEPEIREVWAAAGELHVPFGQFVRLLLLTLGRLTEVAEMRWSEVDLEGEVWTIPGERTKNGKAHAVHLSEAAREVLAAIPRLEDQDFVFSTNGKVPISNSSLPKRKLDAVIVAKRSEAAQKAGGEPETLEPYVFHDFRRTGVSTLARLGFDSIVVDKLLNHHPMKLRGVAGVYQRYEFAPERARALDAWAKWCTDAASLGDNVASMRRAG